MENTRKKKENIIKDKNKKNYKNMDLRISLLNFNFIMIHIVHKFLVLIKNHMSYFKDNIFKCIFKKCNRLLVFLKK